MNLVKAWSRLLVTWPWLVSAILGLSILVMTCVVMILDGFVFSTPLLNDFLVSDNRAVMDYEVLVMGFKEMARSVNVTTRSLPVEAFDCCAFKIMYESRSADVVSMNNVKAMCEFESLFVKAPTRPLYCKTAKAQGMNTDCDLEDTSLVGQFYDFSSDFACDDLNAETFEAAREAILTDDDSFFFGDSFKMGRSQYNLGGPLGPDTTNGKNFSSVLLDTGDPQYSYYEDFMVSVESIIFRKYGIDPEPMFSLPYHVGSIALNDDLSVRFFSQVLYNVQLDKSAMTDATFVVFAIILVYIFSYVHIRSHVLCTVALSMIMMCLVVGMFLLKYVFGVAYFSSLSMTVLFIVLGIGADGFYVIHDAWKQSKELWPSVYGSDQTVDVAAINMFQTGNPETERTAARLTFTLNRAASSVFYTAVTTIIAFVATALSPLLPLSSFGMYAATVVSVNFIWVMTAFPVALVLHDRHTPRQPQLRLPLTPCCQTKHRDAKPSGEKNAFASQVADESNKDRSQGARVEEGLNEAADASHVAKDRQDNAATEVVEASKVEQDGVSQTEPSWLSRAYLKFMTLNCTTTLGSRSFKVYYVAVVSVIGIASFAGFLFSRFLLLGTPSTPDEYYKTQHMFRDFLEEFHAVTNEGTEGAFAPVQLTFGIEGVDRRGFDKYDPNGYRGAPAYKSDFNAFSRKAQQGILDTCERIRQINCTDSSGKKVMSCNSFHILREGSLNCVMEDFHRWYADVIFPTSGITVFQLGDNYPEATKQLFLGFVTGNLPRTSRTYYGQVGIVDGQLKFIVVDFKIDMTFMLPVGRSAPVWDIMFDFKEELQRSLPQELLPVVLASYELVWVVVQKTTEDTLLVGLSVCFPFAFIVLVLSSRNLIISVFAIVTIVLICFSCLGFVQVLGWMLGIGETMLSIMIIGLSVDYVIHLGHLYADGREAHKYTRRERFEHAVCLMLDTVIAAWLTTGLSALIMLFGTTGLFEKMAILISSAISFSMLYSAFFFLPLLLLFGPEGDFAQISCDKFKWKSWGKSAQISEGSATDSDRSQGEVASTGSSSDNSAHAITLT